MGADTLTHNDLPRVVTDLIPEVRDVQRSRHRRLFVRAVVLLLVAAVTSVVTVTSSSSGGGHTGTTRTGGDGGGPKVWDPGSQFIRLDGPEEAAFSGSSIWITNGAGGTVVAVNSTTGRLVYDIPFRTGTTGDYPYQIAADAAYVWVEGDGSDSVVQYRSSTGATVRTIHSPGLITGSGDMASCGGNLWVANGTTLAEFSAATGRSFRRMTLAADGVNGPFSVVTQGAQLWVGDGGQAIADVDCDTGAVERTISSTVPSCCTTPNFVPVGLSMWVSGHHEVTQLSDVGATTLRSFSSAAYKLTGGPIAVGDRTLWELSSTGNEATVINLATGRLVATITWGQNYYGMGLTPTFVAISDDKAWVLNGLGNSVEVYDASTARLIGRLGGVGPSAGCGCLP